MIHVLNFVLRCHGKKEQFDSNLLEAIFQLLVNLRQTYSYVLNFPGFMDLLSV